MLNTIESTTSAIRAYACMADKQSAWLIQCSGENAARVLVRTMPRTTQCVVIIPNGGGTYSCTLRGVTYHVESMAVAETLLAARRNLLTDAGGIKPGYFDDKQRAALAHLFRSVQYIKTRVDGGANWYTVVAGLFDTTAIRVL